MLRSILEIRKTDVYSSYPVKYTNLSGFTIEAPVVSEEFNVQTDMKVVDIRSRFMALMAA
jgi:hypothetical protein